MTIIITSNVLRTNLPKLFQVLVFLNALLLTANSLLNGADCTFTATPFYCCIAMWVAGVIGM